MINRYLHPETSPLLEPWTDPGSGVRAEVAERFRRGWPSKLAVLSETLGAPVCERGAGPKEIR